MSGADQNGLEEMIKKHYTEEEGEGDDSSGVAGYVSTEYPPTDTVRVPFCFSTMGRHRQTFSEIHEKEQ